ncbi:MAG: hypothetical protein PHS14_14515 [Elusimicrobia bacterium]|nr:hypothetical protein [Elusimicrobiota bacterium]
MSELRSVTVHVSGAVEVRCAKHGVIVADGCACPKCLGPQVIDHVAVAELRMYADAIMRGEYLVLDTDKGVGTDEVTLRIRMRPVLT